MDCWGAGYTNSVKGYDTGAAYCLQTFQSLDGREGSALKQATSSNLPSRVKTQIEKGTCDNSVRGGGDVRSPEKRGEPRLFRSKTGHLV